MRAVAAHITILVLTLNAPVVVCAQTVADALDQPGLTFTLSGDAAWFGQTTVTYDAIDALESGPIGDGQVAAVEVTCDYLNSGRVRFWWRVSSEQDRDVAVFSVDGGNVGRISGEVAWQEELFRVGAGIAITGSVRYPAAEGGSDILLGACH